MPRHSFQQGCRVPAHKSESHRCSSDRSCWYLCRHKDTSKIDRLNNGEIPIYEPELDNLVEKNVEF
ncbi:MAG: hypothetical protein HON14_15735, partial [Rhodospirillaceae bacterium]|nr:hypothetical protein [Rhodospirillaceae bacterium]